MKKLIFLACSLLCFFQSHALTGSAYMERFHSFMGWYQQLPLAPDPAFLAFVKESTPLANKLRDKWLYELARLKDWPRYTEYYQPSRDINLVCFNHIAHYHLGHEQEALRDAQSIWLTSESLPQSCTTLFDLFLKNGLFKQELITERLALALDKRNLHLARYLLKHYKIPHSKEADLLSQIHQNPKSITRLEPNEFSSLFYLYGLKRLVSTDMEQAIKLWQQPKTRHIMNERDQQSFLAHVALYKAMRGNEDTPNWFAKVKPSYRTEIVMDWQIRYALKQHQWHHVIALIQEAKNKNEPCWQYWLARAHEALGQKEQAQTLYESLSRNRHYYGFLASQRLHKKPSMENEHINTDLSQLQAYQSIINQIDSYYSSKNYTQASRLLNDFISELPKEEASTLVYWVATRLQWHGKSVYLSNNELLNNKLALRFPLAYQQLVENYAKQYNMPPEFVYAIIRQESSFREDAVSGVGARGLMQVMPTTAKAVSKTSRIDYAHQDQLFTSQKNIHIGTAYLQQLAKRFANHPMLIAAAYNAGPRQVVQWIQNSSSKDMDLWIETLPWQETRNYLKNVMAFSIVYQYRLNHKPNPNPFLTQLKVN